MELSTYQKQITEYFVNNPGRNMAISALAGCAKTTTALLLSETTSTSDVYIAFNKSIQQEMQTKLKNPKTKCYTMHGLCLGVMSYNLKQENKEYKLNNYKINEIVEDLFNDSYKNSRNKTMSSFAHLKYLSGNYSTLYNIIRLKLIPIEENYIKYTIDELGLFRSDGTYNMPDFEEVMDWLKYIDKQSQDLFESECICDFTDMLYITYLKLKDGLWEIPYWNYYTNIYFDEFQDASPVQYFLIKFFKRKNGRFVLIFDKNQAIYGFAGADCNATDKIDKIFGPIEHFKLPINYRCGTKILDYTNKEFNVGIQPRPNATKGNVEVIPYDNVVKLAKPGDFIIGRLNKDLIKMAMLLVSNGKRVFINDPTLVNRLTSFIKGLRFENNVVNTMYEFHSAMNELRSKNDIKGQELDPAIIDNMDVLTEILYYYESDSASIQDFIEFIQNSINCTHSDGCISLMSIHKSKGLEENNVFVLHEAIPFTKLAKTPDMLQQERNLSYVAITRAKENLYLVQDIPEDKEDEF